MRRPNLRRFRLPRQPAQSAPVGARNSIANQLRWSLLLSSTLPLLLVGALLLSLNASAQQRSVYNDQVDLANRVERDIARYVDELRGQFDQFALKVRPRTSPAQLVNLAKDLVNQNYPYILDLAVLDGRGSEQLHMIKLLTIMPDALEDRSAIPSVQQALREERTTYSPIARNKDGIRSFVVTLPIRNDANTVVGALQAEVSAEPLAQDLKIAISNSKSYPYLEIAIFRSCASGSALTSA